MDDEQLGICESVLRMLRVAGQAGDSSVEKDQVTDGERSHSAPPQGDIDFRNCHRDQSIDTLAGEVLYIFGMIGLACFTGSIAVLLPQAIDKTVFAIFGIISLAVGASHINQFKKEHQRADLTLS